MIFKNLTGGQEYQFDEYNKEVINQIYFYLTMNQRYQGDLHKGLFMIGDYGTGKTRMMEIIKYLIEVNGDRKVTFISCPNLLDVLKKNSLEYYYKRPIILDELGRETKVVKDYGTERHPMIELLTQRYNQKAWTFATSNFDQESLLQIYGGYIMDRFIEMFNFLEIKGKSRRI